ncbi:MAG: urate hydroxylase PuuD [Armatimonadota bacterium]|nr:urate hydroxylase PuuD [Armatimonadota bacterium]MDR7437160.1 urate hydroxylase PuuD [Armatimonadota bacterium]MDR7471912.1 urate hydroxylase PuuD [Armatimonadota bacterium]MDR7510377.1 urate hydroxylase PuuD [Armatimonadota bacterium]
MPELALEWLGLLLRWIHVIAGIMWIGDSLLFMWIDSHLSPDPQGRREVTGVTWLLHGGGYYHLEKRLLVPGQVPPRLRWFWLEATTTWISGFLLLIVVYYMSADVMMVDPAVAALTPRRAVAFGLGMLAGGWLAYDLLWRSGLRHRPAVALALSGAALAGLIYAATSLLSARAAYLQVGATLGTIMAANVWVHILPPQWRMLQAARAGRPVDYALGVHAKTRSTHNTYITFPVIFTMLSQHFPAVYAARPPWLVLLLFVVAGAGARHLMLVGWRSGRATAAVTAAALVGVVYLTAAPVLSRRAAPPQPAEVPALADVRAVIVRRCAVCHSDTPTMPGVAAPPGHVRMDTPGQIRSLAARIRARAVEQRTMPPGNITGITDDERDLLRRWIDAGAPLR